MESNIEYIRLFMEYESDDMPVVYFYEVDLNNERFALRAIEVYIDRHVSIIDDLYQNVIEVTNIPTIDEFIAKVWGDGFNATVISKQEFDEIYNSGNYNGNLSVD